VKRLLAAAGLCLLIASTSVVSVPARTAAAAPRFALVDQTFNVEAAGAITITLQVPTTVTPPAADFTLTFVAHRPVDTRAAVADAINGQLPRSVDSVDLDPTLIARPAADQLQATVPIEIDTRTSGALLMSQPGLYPVLVELSVGGDVLAELITFVHRLPTVDEVPEDPMPVAMAVTTAHPVTLDDAGRVAVDDATLLELTELADLLESSAVPLGVRVPPSVLAALPGLGGDGAALAERLSQAMQRNDLLSSPILPLDPSQAAAADQQALYTQWLRDGEDSLSTSMSSPTQRTIVVIDTPLSQAGGAMLRDLGARLLIMQGEQFDGLPNTIGGFADTTQLVQIQVTPGVTVDTAIVDRIASRTLERVTTNPELSAIYTVTDLLAARQQVEDIGGDPRRHSITLATTDFSLPSATGFSAFTTLLAETPGLTPTTLDDLSVRTDQLLGPEGPIIVDLPDEVPGDISPRIDLRNELGLRGASTGSMLPDDDPRIAEWARLVGVLPSSALTDAQTDGIATDLRRQYDAILASVEAPAGFSFNLTGTSGTVPVTLRNNADIPLTVRVRLTSSKLVPSDDQTVELPPQSFHEVKIRIEARSRGDLPVTLEVLTPLGDVRVTEPVPLTASINALSGVGNLVTGAGLLVLLTWWVRHIRKNHRQRRAVEASHRHPATQNGGTADRPEGDPEDTPTDTPDDTLDDTPTDRLDDSTELSPDAATSTLPPS
jgi:Family of unknown function (DUF6049)